jgi:uncharacterized protein (DUF2249 family)
VTGNDVPEKRDWFAQGSPSGEPGERCRGPETSQAPEPVPDWLSAFAPDAAATIDVRPILAEHREPFAAVMATIGSLPENARLIVEAPFNPLPLRQVLGRMGFATYGERLGDAHWRIWCARQGKAPGEEQPETYAGAPAWTAADGVHIDVRGLPPPAPLHAILSLIDSERHDGLIVVHHEREPLFLFPELAERGWMHALAEGEPGEVRLVLRRGPA